MPTITDWSKRIRALRKTGLTLREIGEHAGLSTSAVSDLAQGRNSQPKGDAGLRLYALHLSRCGKVRVNGKRRG